MALQIANLTSRGNVKHLHCRHDMSSATLVELKLAELTCHFIPNQDLWCN